MRNHLDTAAITELEVTMGTRAGRSAAARGFASLDDNLNSEVHNIVAHLFAS